MHIYELFRDAALLSLPTHEQEKQSLLLVTMPLTGKLWVTQYTFFLSSVQYVESEPKLTFYSSLCSRRQTLSVKKLLFTAHNGGIVC